MESNMRYIVKFTNGYHKVFDTQKYEDVSMHGLKTDADKACQRLNTQR